jgi:hypothetical protein
MVSLDLAYEGLDTLFDLFLVSLFLSIRIISLLRSNKVAKTCFFLGELVKISARN